MQVALRRDAAARRATGWCGGGGARLGAGQPGWVWGKAVAFLAQPRSFLSPRDGRLFAILGSLAARRPLEKPCEASCEKERTLVVDNSQTLKRPCSCCGGGWKFRRLVDGRLKKRGGRKRVERLKQAQPACALHTRFRSPARFRMLVCVHFHTVAAASGQQQQQRTYLCEPV